MPTLGNTMSLMQHLHRGQVDKAGQPYHRHPERVLARLVRRWPDVSPDSCHAALLHDVMEDCGVTRADLLRKGYGLATVEIVELLSGNQPMHAGRTYMERIKAIAESGNRDAIRVKLADLEDNSDPDRPLPPGMERLARRYRMAKAMLEAAVS